MRIWNVEVTNHCNSQNCYCPQPFTKRAKGFMSMETYTKVLDKQELGFLELHGFGEPLLHPNICELVRLGKERKFYVKFSTNGLLLNEDIMEKLRAAKLDLLYISLKPFFEQTVSFLNEHYREYKDMLCLLYIENKDQMKPLNPNWKVTRYEPHNWSGQVDMPNPNRKHDGCPILRIGAVTVLWDGKVTACCRDCEGVGVLGSIDDDHLQSRRFQLCDYCDLKVVT